MPFPPAFLDELNNRNPIEDVVGQYVTLTRKGSNLFGLCPFHSEKTPSFSISRTICDYIAGMTDKYAIYTYSEIFIPTAWQVR